MPGLILMIYAMTTLHEAIERIELQQNIEFVYVGASIFQII